MIFEQNEMIERYILGDLNGKVLLEFQKEMERTPQLAAEVNFWEDFIGSIKEKDIIDLRSNLQSISSKETTKAPTTIYFDLAQNLTNNPDSSLISEQILIENTLQQIHIENHKKRSNERIHEIKFQTDKDQEALLMNQINNFSFWEEIKEATLEKDIIDLRKSLKDITALGKNFLNDYEIDEFLSKESTSEEIYDINETISTNVALSNQIQLHQEIDQAINENDIIKLRNAITLLIEKEQELKPSSVKQIDDYLMDYLDEKEKIELENLLIENFRFEQEVLLNKEINDSITESDIRNLRTSLSSIIKDNKDSSKIRKLVPDKIREKPLRFIGAAASIAAIVSAGALSLSHENISTEKLYRQAYQPYEATGLFRSATVINPAIYGVDLYNAHRYDEALVQFSSVLQENNEHPMCNFFSGLCYMEKNQFDKAITSFQIVINEKDNLFVEQAQWYMALSLLNNKQEEDAYALLNQIVENKGYYKKNAKDLIKKLK